MDETLLGLPRYDVPYRPALPLRRRPAVPVAYGGYRSGPGPSLPPSAIG